MLRMSMSIVMPHKTDICHKCGKTIMAREERVKYTTHRREGGVNTFTKTVYCMDCEHKATRKEKQ